MQSGCEQYNIVDLWTNNSTYNGLAFSLNGTQYEEFMFRDHVVKIIREFNEQLGKLFLVYTPHISHCPLQVPKSYLDQFQFEDDENLCQQQTPYIYPGFRFNSLSLKQNWNIFFFEWKIIFEFRFLLLSFIIRILFFDLFREFLSSKLKIHTILKFYKINEHNFLLNQSIDIWRKTNFPLNYFTF